MQTCHCGGIVEFPAGPGDLSGSFSGTMVEDADAETAQTTIPEEVDIRALRAERKRAAFRPVASWEARRANKQMLIWSVWLLVGVSMVVHTLMLWNTWQQSAFWKYAYWGYVVAAVLIFPLALVKWFRSKRQWQRGRGFFEALSASFQVLDEAEGGDAGG